MVGQEISEHQCFVYDYKIGGKCNGFNLENESNFDRF